MIYLYIYLYECVCVSSSKFSAVFWSMNEENNFTKLDNQLLLNLRV